ncbi:MAG: Tyrosine recombinase XerC [Desulfovibrio sp.]
MKFTKRAITAIEATDKRQVFFDDEYPGFALRVSETGRKSFYYTYRPGKGRGVEKKWVMLGVFPAMSVEQGRDKAKDMAAAVQQGLDPALAESIAKKTPTVAELLKVFQQEHIAAKLKKNTEKLYTHLIENAITPVLGKLRITEVEHRHVSKMHHALRETPYTANRAYAVVSKFFAWAEKNGYRPRGSNPALGIEKYKEHKRIDFMGAEELSKIGDAIAVLEANCFEREAMRERKEKPPKGMAIVTPQAANVIRLLCLTGARAGEILSLRWEYLDLDMGLARLPDSKTGAKVLHLPKPAIAVLESIPKYSGWVFPGGKGDGHMTEVHHAWRAICKKAGLTGWRIHDLRHAFASVAVNSGHSLPQIGALLGHSQASTTQRYAHVAENPVHAVAEDAAARVEAALKANRVL